MNRINIQTVQPLAYEAMFGLETYLRNSTITNELQEIIRIRASLVNQCQFCIGMHSNAASVAGASQDKIDQLKNWQESSLYSQKERAALQVTDCITKIADKGLPDTIYQAAAEVFSEEELAQLIVLVATINAWNRLGISMSESR